LYELIQPFANPTIGLVAGSIDPLPGKTLIEQYQVKNNPLNVEGGLLCHFCPYSPTANVAVRYQVFEQVGLFRSYLTTGGDIDLWWRVLKQTSWQYCYAKQSIVLHSPRSTLRQLCRQYRRYGQAAKFRLELWGVEAWPGDIIELDTMVFFKRFLYPLILWSLKLPIITAKIIIGKANIVDIIATPIDLILLQAGIAEQKEARLSEEAKQIPQIYSTLLDHSIHTKSANEEGL
jgi:hypothetical protein